MKVWLLLVGLFLAGQVLAAPGGCQKLDLVTPITYPVVALDSNVGYPGPVMSFLAPINSKCVELQLIAAIETAAPLEGTTTAGIVILGRGGMQQYSVKVLGREDYEQYANENTVVVTAPVIDGRVKYQLLSLFPPTSDSSTTTGVVVAIVGVYR